MGYEHDPRCPAHTSGYVECECNTILRTQLAEAKAEVVREHKAAGAEMAEATRQRQRAERAEADNARLREALEKLLEVYCSLVDSGDCGCWESKDDECVIEARQALADTPEATQ